MKLLFFDIDGTLMADDGSKYIPQSTYDAIKQARKNGNKAFINTGRCNAFMEDIHREIGFDGFVCGCGTEVIIDGKSVMHNQLSRELSLDIAKKIIDRKLFSLIEHSDRVMISKDGVMWDYHSKETIDIYADDFVFDKFAVFNIGMDDEIVNYVSDSFEIIDRVGENTLEIVPKGFSKATGMEMVSKHYGLTLGDCIAFGDSPNDLAMIHAAGYAVTMGKCQSVDKYADYVTERAENDGIYLAMKHLELI